MMEQTDSTQTNSELFAPTHESLARELAEELLRTGNQHNQSETNAPPEIPRISPRLWEAAYGQIKVVEPSPGTLRQAGTICFRNTEERLRWRTKVRGTLPPSAETAENLAKPLLDFPVLLMPHEFHALTHLLPEAEQRTRLGAMMSLRGKLWALVRAEDAAELSRIYEQTTVETIRAALEETDMPRIFRK